MGRIVGLDVGERRIGLAISDGTATLARPLGVVQIASLDVRAVSAVADRLAALGDEERDVERIVVGLPRHLDGRPNAMTPRVEAFARALGERLGRPVALQDERLTSIEAEQLLARREKDWRRRKAQLDATAAAIILQDFLDGQAPPEGPEPSW